MERKMIKSFYDWCIENNRYDLLDRWDKINICNPEDISFSTHKSFYFICSDNLHNSELFNINSITSMNLKGCCSQCNSFYTWCLNNNKIDFIELWNDELNMKSIKSIPYGSKKKYYFRCPRNLHESELKSISSLVKYKKLYCDQCNSIAQWGIDNICKDFLEKYWSEKNSIDPYKVSYGSKTKIWIKCQLKDYHKYYNIGCNSFTSGVRCPYCKGNKLNINDSLGVLVHEISNIWSDKNIKTFFDYSVWNDAKVWWKCQNNKHNDYYRSISSSHRSNFECPLCVKENKDSKLQKKVYDYIISNYSYKIEKEYNCSIIPKNPKTKMLMPYDNEIVELKLIIEVMGLQHYKKYAYSSIWKSNILSPDEQLYQRKLYDRYKKLIAYANGFYFLYIPYWTEINESYKTLIDDKINEILDIKKAVNL
jgi:hypothetical protein